MEAASPLPPRAASTRSRAIVPVGAFLAFHLFVNAQAARGADAYNATAARLQRASARASSLEVFVIALPIVFHGIYGLFVIGDRAARPDGRRAGGRRARDLPARDGHPALRVRPVSPVDGAPRPGPRSREPRSLPPDAGRRSRARGCTPLYVAGLLGGDGPPLGRASDTFADAWGLAPGPRGRTVVAAGRGRGLLRGSDGPRPALRSPRSASDARMPLSCVYNPRSFEAP